MDEPAPTGLSAVLRQSGPIPLDAEVACVSGELLALVGPSGAGKSTILRSIAGLYRPAQGRIVCDDAVWLDSDRRINLPPQRRTVGFVFQHYALFPHMSALDNVAAALGHVPPRDREARARELLEAVFLGGLEERRPAALSGGQQQRVALARALARDPSVLLLDEPFSAVDQVTRDKLQEELTRHRRRLNLPIVLVTHDLNEAVALADRMSIVYRGRTLQTGPPRQVMTQPRDSLVARLVNLRNLFDGTIMGHNPEAGITFVRWRDRTLEAAYNPGFEAESPVDWIIPASKVILHRPDRPSKGEWENPVRGIVGEMMAFGDTVRIALLIDGRQDRPLFSEVSVHVAQRHSLGVGMEVSVSLVADAIHLMAPRPEDDPRS